MNVPEKQNSIATPATRCKWIVATSILLRVIIGILLVWAAIGKILDPETFGSQVAAYQIVGTRTASVLSVLIPWTEFVIGVCLVLGIVRHGAGMTAIGLFIVFLAARSIVYHRGLQVACGCGLGFGDETITGRALVFSAGLLLGSIVSYVVNVGAIFSPVIAVDERNEISTAEHVQLSHGVRTGAV